MPSSVKMAKKGIPNTKFIEKTMIGVREDKDLGPCVLVEFDEFQIFLTAEKAHSMAAQLFAKVRKLGEEEETRKREEKEAEEQRKHPELPFATQSA